MATVLTANAQVPFLRLKDVSAMADVSAAANKTLAFLKSFPGLAREISVLYKCFDHGVLDFINNLRNQFRRTDHKEARSGILQRHTRIRVPTG